MADYVKEYIGKFSGSEESKDLLFMTPNERYLRLSKEAESILKTFTEGKGGKQGLLNLRDVVSKLRDIGELIDPWPVDMIRYFTEIMFDLREVEEIRTAAMADDIIIVDATDEAPPMPEDYYFPIGEPEAIRMSATKASWMGKPKSLMHVWVLDKIIFLDSVVHRWVNNFYGGHLPKTLSPKVYQKLSFFAYEGTPFHKYLEKMSATEGHPEGKKASKYTTSTGIEPFDRPVGKGMQFNPIQGAKVLAQQMAASGREIEYLGIVKPAFSFDHLFNPRQYQPIIRYKYPSDKIIPMDRYRIFMVMNTRKTISVPFKVAYVCPVCGLKKSVRGMTPKELFKEQLCSGGSLYPHEPTRMIRRERPDKALSDIPANMTYVKTGPQEAVPYSVFDIINMIVEEHKQQYKQNIARLPYRAPVYVRTARAAVRYLCHILKLGYMPTDKGMLMAKIVCNRWLKTKENPSAMWIGTLAGVYDLLLPHPEIYQVFTKELLQLMAKDYQLSEEVEKEIEELYPIPDDPNESLSVYNINRIIRNRIDRIENIFSSKVFIAYLRHIAALRKAAPAEIIKSAMIKVDQYLQLILQEELAKIQAKQKELSYQATITGKQQEELLRKRDQMLRLINGDWSDLNNLAPELETALYNHVRWMLRGSRYIPARPFKISYKKKEGEPPKTYIVHYALSINGISVPYDRILWLLKENKFSNVDKMKDTEITAKLLNERSIKIINLELPHVLEYGGIPEEVFMEWLDEYEETKKKEAAMELLELQDELKEQGVPDDEIELRLISKMKELGVSSAQMKEQKNKMLASYRQTEEEDSVVEVPSGVEELYDAIDDVSDEGIEVEEVDEEEVRISKRTLEKYIERLEEQIAWREMWEKYTRNPEKFIKAKMEEAREQYKMLDERTDPMVSLADEAYSLLVDKYGEFNVLNNMLLARQGEIAGEGGTLNEALRYILRAYKADLTDREKEIIGNRLKEIIKELK